MDNGDSVERTHSRVHSMAGRVTLVRGDDSQPYQQHQVEGYPGEIYNNIQRMQAPGHSSMPLPGAQALVIWQSGRRGHGTGTIIAVEHGLYRPTGLKPGEAQLYAIDEADAKGKGGKVWPAFQALLGKVAKVLGKTISMGDANTNAISLTGSGSLTITLTGQSVTITGATGDVVVNGISLVNHVHTGVEPGGGLSGPPAA